MKLLVPFEGDNSSRDVSGFDLRTNHLKEGENDGDEAATLYLKKIDPLGLDKTKTRA